MTTQNGAVQFAYSLNDQGVLTHISEAQRSQAYTCPGCKKPLTPVLGRRKANHFRHYEECCAFESYLHKCAKQAFLARYEQALSNGAPIELTLQRSVHCSGPRLELLANEEAVCRKSVPARYNLIHLFDQAELEKPDRVSGLKPDVMLSDSVNRRRCFVEICVTHACSQEKIASGIPILEFKVSSESDIELLLSGSYSVEDPRLYAYNWRPPMQRVSVCNNFCAFDDIEMSVWNLSEFGRLNERSMRLSDIDLAQNSRINVWPTSTGTADESEHLRTFLRHADPHTQFPNCLRCKHGGLWERGYISCHFKGKTVPYTEARHCASYRDGA